MKKILGLDLGVTSIGWAIVDEKEKDNEVSKIIALGSRIIPLSTDDKDEFTSGNAISKNQKRTTKRTQRKGYDRYQQRRDNLIKALKKAGMLPTEQQIGLFKLDLWKLRADAVNNQIKLPELGRVLLHLNQKRGYKSSRRDGSLNKKDTEYVAQVKNRYELIKEANLTIGQYFYNELLKDETFRTKEKIFPREAYIEEFDLIIKEQQKYYSTIVTDSFINQVRNEIIYYQRKLKSQKGLVSVCEFEGFKIQKGEKEYFVGPKVSPKSSPLFQVCKIWETINNINLKDRHGKPITIPIEKKNEIFNYLNDNETLSYAELIKILDYKRDDVYGNKQLVKGLQGNTTKTQIQKCFEDNSFDHLLKFEIKEGTNTKLDKETGEIYTFRIIMPEVEKEPLYQLWHIIYSISEKEECIKVLSDKFKISIEIAEKLASIDFTRQAFGNKSVKAMRKMLPYLIEGYVYSKACALAGYNHSDSITKEENLQRILLDKLEPIAKNSFRQPVVEKILNQMINVINAIIDQYGKPDEIRVELARELKQSKDERNDMDKAMRRIEQENVSIKKDLEEFGLRPTRNNIIKWRLYHEVTNEDKKLNACCIYCGQPISLIAAIKGAEIDIEHIIPQSKLFDNSQSNKTLAHRRCNATKDDRTAYDFMKSKSEAEFNDYIERVNALFKNGLIKKAKRDKLLMPGDEIPQDFIDRQLRQTQYISRKSMEILNTICYNVFATSGTITSELRHLWGWDEALMNLQLPIYRELGLTEKDEWNHEKIINWTKRDDHRHHAIDALTIACTKQSFIQRINTLNSGETRDEMVKAIKNSTQTDNDGKHETTIVYEKEKLKLYETYLLKNRPFTTKEVEDQASRILISFKAGKKVACNGVRKIKKSGKKVIVQTNGIIVPRGALSEESIYGEIRSTEMRPVKYLFENPDKIVKKHIKCLVEERLALNEGDVKKALASLKKEPIMLHEKEELTQGRCFKNEYVIKYPIQQIKAKDIESIIDGRVREIVRKRLEAFGNKEKEAFKNLEGNPVWYNEQKKIAIKTVRCFTGLSAVEPIRKNEDGKSNAFVKPGNNHHIAIYIDADGKKQEHVCTFWHAVERKKYGIPIVIQNPEQMWQYITQQPEDAFPQSFLEKLPDLKWKFEFSMQQNEMFLLGLKPEEAEIAIRTNDYSLLSKYLYRVQKITNNDYYFRYHLETRLKDDEENKRMGKYLRKKSISSLLEMNPIKVRVNLLGIIGFI